jgi:hypothetical protein
MSKNSDIQLEAVIPGLDMGAPFQWKFGPDMGPVSEVLDGCRDMYKQYIEEANQ